MGEYFELPSGEHRCTLPDPFFGTWMEWHRAPGYDKED